MEPIEAYVLAGIVELAKAGISFYCESLKKAGMTDEQILQLFVDTHAKFMSLPDPEKIPV